MTVRHSDGRVRNLPVWRWRRTLAPLSAVSALVAITAVSTLSSSLLAQTPSTGPGHLSVRPHEMATGRKTEKSGEQQLDSVKGVSVYVPKQCVGTRRCPLVVFLHGDDQSVGSGKKEVAIQSEMADRYGMILLAPDNISADSGIVDAAIKEALRSFAVDPDKIALAGEQTGGIGALFFGRKNLDVFSRIAALSATSPRPTFAGFGGWPTEPSAAHYPDDTTSGPRNTKTRLFVSVGIGEASDDFRRSLEIAQQGRQEGHTVQLVLNFRLHALRPQDYDCMWRWLRDSWAPNPTARVASTAASVPLLTVAALPKLTAFWTGLLIGADSGRIAEGVTHTKEVRLPVGRDQMSVYDMVDVPALSTKYPSVAAALKSAGLTAEEEEGYQMALISAWATKVSGVPVDTSSVIGKNLAFINTYKVAESALDELFEVPKCQSSPAFLAGCKERGDISAP